MAGTHRDPQNLADKLPSLVYGWGQGTCLEPFGAAVEPSLCLDELELTGPV